MEGVDFEKSNKIYELFDEQPILKVEEYKLRSIRDSDSKDILEIYINRKDKVYDRFPKLDDVKEVENFIKILKGNYEAKERVDWAVENNGKVIGLIAIHSISIVDSRCEIGYILNQDYTNRGIMSKLIKFIIDYLFNILGMHKIEAIVNTENIPSIKLCKKLGFIEEGLKKEYWFNFEEMIYIDVYIFSIINKQSPLF